MKNNAGISDCRPESVLRARKATDYSKPEKLLVSERLLAGGLTTERRAFVIGDKKDNVSLGGDHRSPAHKQPQNKNPPEHPRFHDPKLPARPHAGNLPDAPGRSNQQFVGLKNTICCDWQPVQLQPMASVNNLLANSKTSVLNFTSI